MKPVRVNALLLVSMLVMTALPMTTALYFTNNAVATSLNIGFNPEVIDALETNAQNLKHLGKLDPDHQAQYRAEFDKLLNLKSIYGDKQLLEQSIRHSLLIYFALGMAVAVLTSVVAATMIGRHISRSYQSTFAELVRQRDRNRFLEEIGSWQELAKMLAHEIKNPLTPIQMLVTSLTRAHRERSTQEFAMQLAQTDTMVKEELAHLTRLVDRFSAFAKLPSVQLRVSDLSAVLAKQALLLNTTVDNTRVILINPGAPPPLNARIDTTLFRQVLTNIVRNGVEANPKQSVTFTLAVIEREQVIELTIMNDGIPVPPELAPRIFDPYISNKTDSDNMGLGLTIVRKIVIEHGGNIVYEERNKQPMFVITLPRLT